MGQFLSTKNYGVIEVEGSWQVMGKQDTEGNQIQQGGHIALLANGAYCHVTGLPINSEQEIYDIFHDASGRIVKGMEGVYEKVLDWFQHRHDNEEKPLPRIMFDSNGWPLFENEEPVLKEEDLYQCLKPGPVLTAAIVGLHLRREAMAKEAEQKPAQVETAPMPAPHEIATPPAAKKSGGRARTPRGAKGRFTPKPKAAGPLAEATV